MEQETRKFAIEQAVKLVSVRQDITDKTKAVLDLAEQIIQWVGDAPVKPTQEPSPIQMPLTYPQNYPQWVCPPTETPYWTTPINKPYEVTCESRSQCNDGTAPQPK